jgi:small subunit ribosomal protein S1
MNEEPNFTNPVDAADVADTVATMASPAEPEATVAIVPAPPELTAGEQPVALAPETAEPEAVVEVAAPNAELSEVATSDAAVSEVATPDAAVSEVATPDAAVSEANAERRKRAQAIWERLVEAKANGTTVEGVVKTAVKGGLLVDIEGFRGFLPASQTRVAKGTPLETLVKTTVPLKVIDVDEGRKRLVVSHRRAMEEERRASRADLIRSLTVGEERDATVVRLTNFGAFVDLGGVDALIPLSELAFERVESAADVVHPGEHLKVRVMRVEENGKKIAVSRKGALPDPWRDHAHLLRQGEVIEGKVVAKEPRLTIELAPGVVGSLDDREANPDDYEIGETIEVAVRSADHRNRRLRLRTPHSAGSFTSTSFAPLGVELNR